MTRILCLSDTHGCLPDLNLDGIDLVLFAGDFSARQRDDIYAQANDYVTHFSPWAQSIIDRTGFACICGNHEVFVEKLPLSYFNNEIYKHCINDRLIKFKNLSIYGFPWTPTYGNWGFNADDCPQDMGTKCQSIPSNIDILLTHGPPYGVLDLVNKRHTGNKELSLQLDRINPKLVISGHLHDNFGIIDKNGIKFVACPLMDENYEQIRNPIEVEI